MWDFYKETEPKARKSYSCDASQWVIDLIDFQDLPFSEKRSFVRAKRDRFKILPGMKYRKVEGKCEGEFRVWRSRLDMEKIYQEHELWRWAE